jgi:hypothetical protein
MGLNQLVERKLAGEIEVLGENLRQCLVVDHNSILPDLGSNPGCHGGKPATDRLSYGTAYRYSYIFLRIRTKIKPELMQKLTATFYRKNHISTLVFDFEQKLTPYSRVFFEQLIVAQ